MKKVFVKVGGFTLAASLLCSSVPAMALFGVGAAKPVIVEATKSVVEDTAKSVGMVSKFKAMLPALPTWQGTKAVCSRVINAANAKNVVALVKNHPYAASVTGALALGATGYSIYKIVKSFMTSVTEQECLKGTFETAKSIIVLVAKSDKDAASKRATTAEERVRLMKVPFSRALTQKRIAFVAEYDKQVQNINDKKPLDVTELDKMITALNADITAAKAKKTVKTTGAVAGAPAAIIAPTPKAVASPTITRQEAVQLFMKASGFSEQQSIAVLKASYDKLHPANNA